MKLLLYFHNFLYRVISHFAIKSGLHPKHRLTNYHKFFTDNVSSKDTVLDIGCGNGALTYDLACKAETVFGFDIVDNFQFQKDNMCLVKYDATKGFDKRNAKVVVVMSNVLEHLKDRIQVLKNLRPTTSKLLIRVPMLDRDWLTLYKKELGVEYRLDKGHFIEYTEQSFRDEVKEAGYKIVKLEIRFGEIYAILK